MLISTALLLLIVLSVIVYVLRQNCRAAGWRWDTMKYVSVSDWMRFGAVVINRMGYFKVKNIIKEIEGLTEYEYIQR
jgi:hypothetical protein